MKPAKQPHPASRHRTAAIVFAWISLLACAPAGVGCAQKASAVQFIPPAYYDCIEAAPDILVNTYFTRYLNPGEAAVLYNGKFFVFKNITVTQEMLLRASEGYIWFYLIKCCATDSSAPLKLKVGDVIDVVGMNLGTYAEYPGTLQFSDCIFLPAGSVQLPAAGSAKFISPY